MENQAINGIITLCTSEETTSYQPREMTALVIDQIVGACMIAPKNGTETSTEGLRLLHANQYLDKVSQELKSNAPLSYEITGNSLLDTLDNLTRIRNASVHERFSADIMSRLDFFINSIRQLATTYEETRRKTLKKRIVIALLVSLALICAYFFIDSDISYFTVSNWMLIVALWPIIGGVIFFFMCMFGNK